MSDIAFAAQVRVLNNFLWFWCPFVTPPPQGVGRIFVILFLVEWHCCVRGCKMEKLRRDEGQCQFATESKRYHLSVLCKARGFLQINVCG